MFRLTPEESEALRSQIVISKSGRGGRRYTIQAFAEQGVAMLSSILRSKQAVQVNILIMRAFVRLREILATHKGLARKLEELEKKVTRHDKEIKAVFEAIRSLLEPGEPPKSRQIGFQAGQGRAKQRSRIHSCSIRYSAGFGRDCSPWRRSAFHRLQTVLGARGRL